MTSILGVINPSRVGRPFFLAVVLAGAGLGMAVDPRAVKTLVQFNAEGRFVRVEGRPEESALRFLAFDEAQRDAGA